MEATDPIQLKGDGAEPLELSIGSIDESTTPFRSRFNTWVSRLGYWICYVAQRLDSNAKVPSAIPFLFAVLVCLYLTHVVLSIFFAYSARAVLFVAWEELFVIFALLFITFLSDKHVRAYVVGLYNRSATGAKHSRRIKALNYGIVVAQAAPFPALMRLGVICRVLVRLALLYVRPVLVAETVCEPLACILGFGIFLCWVTTADVGSPIPDL